MQDSIDQSEIPAIKREGALEFIKRVEELAKEFERTGENKLEWGITEDWANLSDAFERISQEVKEGK